MATPLNHYADTVRVGGAQLQATIRAYPKYYRDGDPATGQLTETDCTLEPSDHPALSDWMAKKGVASIYVKNDGEYAIKHLGHALRFKLAALVILKPDRTWEVVRTPSYGTPTVDGDTLTWADVFPGVSQQLHAIADQHRDVFTIEQSARDDLATWLTANGYSDLTGHYLAFAYEVAYKSFGDTAPFTMTQQLEGGAEFTNTDNVETTGRIFHLQDGRLKQYFQAGEFRHESAVDVEGFPVSIPKLKRFATVGDKRYFLEGCDLEAFMALPSGAIMSNTTVSYQEGTSGYSGCTDAMMQRLNPNNNYGTYAGFLMDEYYGYRQLIAFDLPDLGSVTVTNAYYTIELYTVDATTVSAYRDLKPWVVGTVTYNDWDGPDLEWATVGCGNGDDSGVENSGDGVGADRKATALFSEAVSATGPTTFGSGAAGLKQLIQDHLDGNATDTYGAAWFEDTGTPGGTQYRVYGRSSSYQVTAERPELTFVYDEVSGFVPYPFSRGLRGGHHALSGGLA